MTEWLYVPLILSSGALFMVAVCEIGARIGTRGLLSGDPEHDRGVRQRLRRAFWDGARRAFDPYPQRRRQR